MIKSDQFENGVNLDILLMQAKCLLKQGFSGVGAFAIGGIFFEDAPSYLENWENPYYGNVSKSEK